MITRISKVGDIYGEAIFRIDETDVLPLRSSTLHLTEHQIQFNQIYLNMVSTILDTPYFYFSYTYDLTYSLQRLYNAGPDFVFNTIFERVRIYFILSDYLFYLYFK